MIAWVFIRYIGFSLLWHEGDRRGFSIRLGWFSAFATVTLFAAIWYYGAMRDATEDISAMNDYSRLAVVNMEKYEEYRSEFTKWLDNQYLEQCRLAARLVKDKGREKITRQELYEYSKELGVKYIYIFDKTGKTIVTNSPYDHFETSRNEKDQSYELCALLNGREYLIQKPQEDELSGENMQYIGVSLRDEEDLSDGFVLIATGTDLRERFLSSFDVQMVMDDLVIGLPDHVLQVDKETMEIVDATALDYVGVNIEELGVSTENLMSNSNIFLDIVGSTYYGSVSESEGLYLIPLVGSTGFTDTLFTAVRLTVCAAAAFLLFILVVLFACRSIPAENEEQSAKSPDMKESAAEAEAETESETDEEMEILRRMTGQDKIGEKYNFESRWKKQSAVPPERQTPEMRAGKDVYFILLAFSTLLILFETSLISFGIAADRLDGFSYVLLGNWEKGVNMFSLSYCLFLMCVLNVFQELLNQVLYRIAKNSDLKRETILLLMRNVLKYACALMFLYLGLAKLGIDTKTLWASAGILSLLVGLAAKDMVSDIIAGLFIIFEGTYKIGDFVSVGSFFGTVEEIGLRYTKIVSFSQTRSFNNSSIRDLINYNGDVAREILKIPVPYELDLLELEKLFDRELPLMSEKIPELIQPPKYQGVNSFEDSCILIRIALYCDPMSPGKARRAVLREFKLLFDREKINIPYDHLVVMDYKDEENTYTFTGEDIHSL